MDSSSVVLEFVDHLMAGRVLQATRLLTPESQATGPLVALRDLSSGLTTRYGRLRTRRVVSIAQRTGVEVVNVLLQFQRESFLCYAMTEEAGIITFAFAEDNADKYLPMFESARAKSDE